MVVAESNIPDDFDSLVARSPRDLDGIRPFVLHLPPSRDDRAFVLAVVQAIVFLGHGLYLGISVHHATCDEASTVREGLAAHPRACAQGA